MAQWRDWTKWTGLRDGTACPICLRGEPLDVIAESDASWVTMGEEAPMRGYACLVFRRHAVDLHDLSDSEGTAFMRDVRRLSAAVSDVTQAVKLNYEVHGNTLPHLHLHVFPRYIGDPFEGKAIDRKYVNTPVYGLGEFVELREKLIDALSRHD